MVEMTFLCLSWILSFFSIYLLTLRAYTLMCTHTLWRRLAVKAPCDCMKTPSISLPPLRNDHAAHQVI